MRKYNPLPKEIYTDTFIDKFELTLKFDENGCFNSLHRPNCGDYIAIHVNGDKFLAHRIAYAIYHNADPGDMMVCHRCDNVKCCNPKHLFLGTDSDNQVDSMSKGRNPRARFTDVEIEKIFELYSTLQYSMINLAKIFGVRDSTINRILRRNSYKHVRIDRKLQKLCDLKRFMT